MKHITKTGQKISAALLGSAILFAAPLFAESIENNRSIFTRVESLSVSESVPVYGLFHDLQGFNFSGESTFTHNEIESGITYQRKKNSWEMSVVKRYSSYLNYSTDTAELLYLDKNDISVNKSRQFNVDLRINQMEAEGLRLAFARQITPSFQVMLTGSWFQSSGLTDGYISGDVVIDADNAISGSTEVEYVYDQDKLFDRDNDDVTGDGYALDIQASLQVSPSLLLQVSIDDLLNRFNWDAAAYTNASLTSSIPTLDANGYFQVSPVLTGIESYTRHTQVLPKRIYSKIIYSVNNHWGLTASRHQVDEILIHQLGAEYRFDNGHEISFLVGDKTNPLTIAYGNQYFFIALRSDSSNYQSAQHLGLNASINLGF